MLSFFGGIGLFLYGMSIMSTGLKNAAGDKMKTILEKVIGFLRGQPARESARRRIREQARPAVQEVLEEHQQKIREMKEGNTLRQKGEER